jgi:hypothetical protein
MTMLFLYVKVSSMKVITDKNALKTALDDFDVEDSIGLCFYNGALNTSFIVAARQAGYVCDRLVVVNLSSALTETQRSILKRVGVDALLEPQNISFKIQGFLKEESKKLTLILASLFRFMPLCVSVSETEVKLMQLLKSLQEDFGDVFQLELKKTPHHLLNTTQKQIRSAVLPCLEALQNGESEVSHLKEFLKKNFQQADIELLNVQFYDADTYEECFGIVSPTCFVAVQCVSFGQKVTDLFTISDI